MMKNKLVKLSAVALAISLSTSAFAVTKQGAYVGVQLGATLPSYNDFDGLIKFDHFGAGWLGGYNFALDKQGKLFIAPELAVNYLGTFRSNVDDGIAYPLGSLLDSNLGVVLNYNVSDKFGVFTKVAIVKQWFIATGFGGISQTLGVTGQFGAGVSYNFHPNMELDFGYSFTPGKKLGESLVNNNQTIQIQSLMVAYKYNF